MAWNDKVLDNLEQVYWTPGMINLGTVQQQPTEDGTGFFVPKERLSGGKSLYARLSDFPTWRPEIARKEELLNQVIEIALAIAPSDFIADAFFAPLDIEPLGRIKTFGREILSRHASLSPKQFTQHDGFYVADNAIVMMEMKLNAQTSVEQYLKYCTLAALEEMLHGEKEHLGFIYLVAAKSVVRTRKMLRLDDEDGMKEIWANPAAFTKKVPLLRLLEMHGEAIRGAAMRLRVNIITWDDFLAALTRYHDGAVLSGNETLENLMQGLINQILLTPDCGLNSSAAAAQEKPPIRQR